jgi:hypothetical protein
MMSAKRADFRYLANPELFSADVYKVAASLQAGFDHLWTIIDERANGVADDLRAAE